MTDNPALPIRSNMLALTFAFILSLRGGRSDDSEMFGIIGTIEMFLELIMLGVWLTK